MNFELAAPYGPAGDQPKAIDQLCDGLSTGQRHQVLLGVTGSGKTFTMASCIARLNRPALVIAHNKTLAAQLCAEFRSFFPQNAVEYFVSYYDYYQPEAYIPQRDIYIEKESQINADIEKLRHRATRALLMRRDVIVVASVSCIYGLGTPEAYIKGVIILRVADVIRRKQLLNDLELIKYERNDIELRQGRYRVNGDVIDIFPVWGDTLIRLDFFGDEIQQMMEVHPVSGEILNHLAEIDIYPATHYVVLDSLAGVIAEIEQELTARVTELTESGKLVEAQRLSQRTKYDMEMMMEMGYCKGIENYSRYISGRPAGSAPGVLLDFFPKDFITIVDESHVTMPQIRGMYNGDRSRKQVLIDYGFRLPSALDNRPLQLTEFEERVGQVVYVSATPGNYELALCDSTGIDGKLWAGGAVVEQIIRPTGLVDPAVDVRPTTHQIDDILAEIRSVIPNNERVLITTLTKKMSEELADYLIDKGIKVRYLHSDIESLERIDILHDLRIGKFDVLVGVNLLREGLDLPEVSRVLILDADKAGFLRNERSLIQTMGRAARNVNGRVVLYADTVTDAIHGALTETERRRTLQLAHNAAHGIIPKTTVRSVADLRTAHRELMNSWESADATPEKLPNILAQLDREMRAAADRLEFELAATIRDKIEKLKKNG